MKNFSIREFFWLVLVLDLECDARRQVMIRSANQHRSRKRESRRGVAALEFALVAPLVFFLVMGMVEYGRMIMFQQVITTASREGARRAVLDDATTADVQSIVQDYLENGSVDGAMVTVTPSPPSSAAAREAVTVSVSFRL